MTGADEDYKVTVTHQGKEMTLNGPVFWDWDDDDDRSIRITVYIRKPESVEYPV
jgi:hypothetical protein